MTLGIGEVEEWDVGALHGFTDDLTSQKSTLTEVEGVLDSASASLKWSGVGFDAATGYFSAARGSITDLAAAAGALSGLIEELAGTVEAIKSTLEGLLDTARAQDFEVTDNGTVIDRKPVVVKPGPGMALGLAEKMIREAARAELETQIKLVLHRADDAEDDATRILNQAARHEISVPPGTSAAGAFEEGKGFADQNFEADLSDLPSAASPAAVKTYWDSLSENDRAEVIAADPLRIAKLNGVPAEDMHKAGVSALNVTEDDLVARRDHLSEALKVGAPRFDSKKAQDELFWINQKLDGIGIIRRELGEHPYNPNDPMGDGRLLLGFDPSGERLKFGIANGNPDYADHTATMVPGMNSTVYSFGRNGDDTGMADEARNIRNESTALLRSDPRTSGETVSTISWMGYDAPGYAEKPDGFSMVQDAVPTAGLDRAKEGGAELDSFLQGREVSAVNPNQHTTVTGHSYGSTTSAYGLDGKAHVDDYVVYGSPGLDVDSGSDLNVDGGQYYMAADKDPITALSQRETLVPAVIGGIAGGPQGAISGGLGGGIVDASPFDTVRSPGELGFTHLGTDAAIVDDGTVGGSHREQSTGHSEYTRSGDDGKLRTSGYNLAAIIADQPEKAIR